MAVVPPILPALDAIRSIGGMLGLRVFKVTVRKRIWTGARPGAPGSTKADLDTVLVNQGADGNSYPVRVKQVSRSEAFASGGQYTARDLRVGPMTPSYLAGILAYGGFDDNTVDPQPTASATEVFWILSTLEGGTHGIPAGGIVCEKRGEENSALHVYVVLRATGRAPT